MRSLQTFLFSLIVIDILIVVPFAWILRDGLGPDAYESSGWPAGWRWFMTFYCGPILLVLIGLLAGLRILKGPNKPDLEGDGDEGTC